MTDTKELDDLIHQARHLGAKIRVMYDSKIFLAEGRRIHSSVQVLSGLRGVGPYPMSPIAAAESLRRANFRTLHNLDRKGNGL